MFNKIKNIIFRILFILILIYLLIFVPTLWGHKPLVIISGSMEPVLKVGGILYYEKIDLDEFKEKDIVVYTTPEDIVSHRLVMKVDNGYITKGDVNKVYDPLVDENQIIGKGTNWSIPLIGYYAHFIYTHKYLLYICIALLIIDLLVDKYKNIKNKNGDNV